MNDARVHDNWIFDNWRDGAMLFAVPDALVNGGGAEGDIFPGVSCPGAPDNGLSTSCGNQFFDNHMGQGPTGFRFPDAVEQFGNVTRTTTRGRQKPNGNDFWWDEFFRQHAATAGSTTRASTGRAASVTGPGEAGRLPGDPPQVLPSDCATSVGNGDLAKLGYLIECATGRTRTPARPTATGGRCRRSRAAPRRRAPPRAGRAARPARSRARPRRGAARTGRRADSLTAARTSRPAPLLRARRGARWPAAAPSATASSAGARSPSEGVGLVRGRLDGPVRELPRLAPRHA